MHSKSFLRWAGSKKQLLPILSDYWSNHHKRYIEPFAGSASLFFYIRPNVAILGDVNFELIETYREIKSNVHELISALNELKIGKTEYYKIRSFDSNELEPVKRAARFIYLNRFCFNGLYRINRKGEFNVPYGGDKSGKIPSSEILYKSHEILKNASLIFGDFEHVLKMAKQGDFIYLDPPYKIKKQRIFNEYDNSIFSWNDLYRLKDWLNELTKKGIEFLLSYAECNEVNILKDEYKIRKVKVKRNIAGFVNNRRLVNEVLITNKHLLLH